MAPVQPSAAGGPKACPGEPGCPEDAPVRPETPWAFASLDKPENGRGEGKEPACQPSEASAAPAGSPCALGLLPVSASFSLVLSLLMRPPCGGRIPRLCKNVTSSQRLGSTVKNAEMTPWTCTLGRKPRRSPAADIAVLPLAVLLCLERDNSTLSKGCSAPRWGWRVTRKPGGAPHTLQDQSSRSCGRGFPLPVQTPVTSMNFTRILGGRDCACPHCSRKEWGLSL